MRNLYKCLFTSIAAVGVAFALAGCNNNSLTATGEIKDIEAMRTSIKYSIIIQDENKELTSVYTDIYKEDDEDKKSIKTETSFDVSKDVTQTKTFTSLDVNTSYVITLYANVDGYEVVLDTETVTTTATGSEDDPIYISSYDDFIDIDKDGDAHYVLSNDINCDGEAISTFFTSASDSFNGSFDGAGYTVSNFTLATSSSSYQGIFGYIGNKGVIKNVTFDAQLSQISETPTNTLTVSRSTVNAGIVAGYSEGTLDNVHVKNALIEAKPTGTGSSNGGQHIGGLIGYTGTKCGNITNCSVENTTINASFKYYSDLGLLIGNVQGIEGTVPTISSNYAQGKLNVTFEASASTTLSNYIGGLIGFNSLTITDSYCDVEITVSSVIKASVVSTPDTYEDAIGGLVGYQKAKTVVNCATKATISYTTDACYKAYVGGIAGKVSMYATVKNSVFVSSLNAITIKNTSEHEEKVESYSNTIGADSSASSVCYVTTNDDITVNDVSTAQSGKVITDYSKFSTEIQNFLKK